MKRVHVSSAVLGVMAIALACSGQIAGSNKTSKGATPLPCDVDNVLARNCRSCHQDPAIYGAPMALTAWEDVQAPSISDPAKKVFVKIAERIHDDAHPMPQAPNARLSGADSATLDAWIAAGAPAATASCSSADAGPDVVVPPSCNPDTHIAPKSAFAMPATLNDEYVCYGFDVPGDKRYAIRIVPRIDNPKIVHHLLLFKAPGGSKYSGTPTKCTSAFGEIGWSIQYGWAPGGNALDMPPEAAIPLDGSTHYVVQIHYNNINQLAAQVDTSGFDMCTTPTARPNEADVIAFGAYDFPQVPAHGTLDWTCDYKVDSQLGGTHLIATWGHMHKIGSLIETTRMPVAGAPIPIIDIPKYDFNGQQWLPKTGTFTTGDTVRTRCAWNNTTDLPVSFGENTENEMCFGFAMYYPKRNFATWAQPSVQASCGVTK